MKVGFNQFIDDNFQTYSTSKLTPTLTDYQAWSLVMKLVPPITTAQRYAVLRGHSPDFQ
jgi:hypothetical protein